MKPTLNIYKYDDSNICIERGDNVTDNAWLSVFFWWTNERKAVDSIKIPINEFLTKRSWLRSNWTNEGGQVEIDNSTKSLLQKALVEKQVFEKELRWQKTDSLDFDDSHLKRPLREFQKESVGRLIQLNSGANFSVPGAGKTSTTLTIWHHLRMNCKVGKLLVIAPKSAHESWETEPDKIFNFKSNVEYYNDLPLDKNVDILLINYEKLESDSRLERIRRWVIHNNAMLVLDEAHRIKGGVNSVRWRACKDLSNHSPRVDILSGTPMPQGFDDLRNLFSLTWPNVPRSFLTDSRLSSLRRGTVFVRTTKEELNLPPINIYLEPIYSGNIQAQIYSALRKSYAGSFQLSTSEESYFGAKGRAVMTLIAAASNPGLLAGIAREDAYMGLEWPPNDISLSESLLSIVEKYASVEIPPKYKWILERCRKASEEKKKILIWSNLVGNIKALAKLLEPFNPAVIYGAVQGEDRKSELKRFRKDPNCHVLISNPQTLGEGVSLHKECHEAIYLDRSYNAGQYLQSLDRIHRLGLPSHQITDIHILQTIGTIDERISPRLEQKITRLSEALNDHGLVKVSLPDEDISLPNEVLGIDQNDLDDLFKHLINDA